MPSCDLSLSISWFVRGFCTVDDSRYSVSCLSGELSCYFASNTHGIKLKCIYLYPSVFLLHNDGKHWILYLGKVSKKALKRVLFLA